MPSVVAHREFGCVCSKHSVAAGLESTNTTSGLDRGRSSISNPRVPGCLDGDRRRGAKRGPGGGSRGDTCQPWRWCCKRLTCENSGPRGIRTHDWWDGGFHRGEFGCGALLVPMRPATHGESRTHAVSAPRTIIRSATVDSPTELFPKLLDPASNGLLPGSMPPANSPHLGSKQLRTT